MYVCTYVRMYVCVCVCMCVYVCVYVCMYHRHSAKHTTHTSEINDTLKYHVIGVAICICLRKTEISDILNFTPIPMLSYYACYDNADSDAISRPGVL